MKVPLQQNKGLLQDEPFLIISGLFNKERAAS